MLRSLIAVLLLSAASAGASVTAEEAAVSERLSTQASDFLASVVGPGHGKVVVTVQGEETHSASQSDYTTPIEKPASAATASASKVLADAMIPTELPGYNVLKAPPANANVKIEEKPKEAAPPEPTRRTQQSSTWESGLDIKQIKASVVLDGRLPEAQIAAVTDLMPKFLHLDPSRGDEISILRADFRVEDWKTAAKGYLQSLEGLRTLALWTGILLVILLGGLLAYFTVTGVIRTFMGEMAAYRAAVLEAEAAKKEEGEEPELLPGGIPSLDEGEGAATAELAAPGGAAPPGVPLLGQRFDFLTAQKPADLAHLFSGEPAQDLALLFATLSASHPDLSATVFSALDTGLRAAVSRSLAAMTIVDRDRLDALENRVKNLVDFGVRGPQRLGTILSRMPVAERDSLVQDVVNSNPSIARELERSLFSFEDILSLKDSDFRRVITAVPYSDWGLAMRGSPEALVKRVLAELDEGTQGMLQEAMANPQPRAKIMEARSKVISRTLALAAAGQIVLSRDASAELI